MQITRRRMALAVLGLLLTAQFPAPAARAADDQAADEIYQINEARRQDLIARQLDLNHRMIWSSNYGPRYPYSFEPYSFNSLARVPGDIWGYPLPRPIEQPIGHESAQTGPNRWTYRPIYAADVRARAAIPNGAQPRRATPAAPDAAALPGPSDRFDTDPKGPIDPGPKGPMPAPGKPAPKISGPRAF